MYLFYILYSASKGKYYIGHTGMAIEERLRKHNSNHKGFTGGVGDWKVFWIETFITKEMAYKREREVKAWKSRQRVEQLIEK